MENAMDDMFLARRTISLSGSSHFSVSASISDVISFISRPTLAIFACSYPIRISHCEVSMEGSGADPELGDGGNRFSFL